MMNKFKWFWITLTGWCVIGAVGARAIILSPFHLDSKEIFESKAEINGVGAQSRLLASSASMDSSLVELLREWQAQGWNCVSGDMNLASVILGVPRKYEGFLDSLAQVRMLQNKDTYRLLGLWSDLDSHQTYQWITDVPRKALDRPDPSDVDFPLKPPMGAQGVLTVKLGKNKNMEVCSWSFSSSRNLEAQWM